MARRKILLLLIAFLFLTAHIATAQRSMSDTVVSSVLFSANYALQFPKADLALQYGMNSAVGASVGYKTDKNWIWSANGNFIFGDRVNGRTELLAQISTAEGEIIDGNGTFTSLSLFERGFHLQAKASKLFSFSFPNPNSGIYVGAGIGYLAHHIRIETQFGTAPQIMGDYAKGYDRLRGGFAHSLEAGYLIMSNSRVLNFSLGFEFIQAFTQSLREYQFDLMGPDSKKYTDQYYGIKVCWIIPAYKRAPQKYYYY